MNQVCTPLQALIESDVEDQLWINTMFITCLQIQNLLRTDVSVEIEDCVTRLVTTTVFIESYY